MHKENYLSCVELSEKNLIHNIHTFKKRIGNTKHMSVVKSNAYGHGILKTAQISLKAGTDYLGVNSINEGLLLRENNIDEKIIVLGFPNHHQLRDAVINKLDLVVYDSITLKKLKEITDELKISIKIHLKVETGLNRQGITEDKFEEFVKILKSSNNIILGGVSTHYANIEDTLDHSYAIKQTEVFKNWVRKLNENDLKPELLHASCSAGAIIFDNKHFDMVRTGISMYGLWPSRETKISSMNLDMKNFQLKPVLSWFSRIGQIKTVQPGSSIGYGCSGYATRELKIAIIPIGYYEGYDRGLSNKSYMLVKGNRAPVIGRIFMNMTIIDVTHIEDINIGEEVTLIGGRGKEKISAEKLASFCGTINYEIITRINENIPRFIV